MNIDDMGVAYSVKHAAALAAQLPITARVNEVEGLEGLSVDELILSQIEYNTRLLIWNQSEDGRRNRNRPKPIFDLTKKKEQAYSMDLASLKSMLSAPRKEAPDGGVS